MCIRLEKALKLVFSGDGRVLWFTHWSMNELKNGTNATVTRSSKWHGAVDVRFHEPLLGTAYTIIHAIAGI